MCIKCVFAYFVIQFMKVSQIELLYILIIVILQYCGILYMQLI